MCQAARGQSLPDDLGLEIIPISKVIDAIITFVHQSDRFMDKSKIYVA